MDRPDFEGDDFITDAGSRGWNVSHSGTFLGTFTEFDDAAEALKEARNGDQFWPNIWVVNDHGNTTLAFFDAAGELAYTDTSYV